MVGAIDATMGKEGIDSGFIDTTANVTPVQTTAVQEKRAPAATAKSPAFEALFTLGRFANSNTG